MAVHLPIAVIWLAPLIDGLGWWWKKRELDIVAVGLYGLGVVSALFATATGQAAFDAAVAAGYEGKLLNVHADDANLVPWLLILVLVARVVAPMKLPRIGRPLALAGAFAMWPMILTVGNSGGDLVYEHGVGVTRTSTTARDVDPR